MLPVKHPEIEALAQILSIVSLVSLDGTHPEKSFEGPGHADILEFVM